MKNLNLLLAVLLSFATAATTSSASAQQDPGATQQKRTILDEADFTLHRHVAEWVDSHALMNTMMSIYGRRLLFDDRTVSNIAVLDDAIVIYETSERLERILKAIEELDSNPNPNAIPVTVEQEAVSTLLPTDMVIKNYQPRNLQINEFFNLARELYGHSNLIQDVYHPNLRMTSNNGLVIYENKAVIAALLKNLSDLDQSQALQANEELVVFEYQPRYLSPQGMMEGLKAFRTTLLLGHGQSRTQAYNISMLEERGLIQVRDREDVAKEIMQTMERLDQPAQQVMVACQILRGVVELPVQSASPELQKQLAPILPYKYYQVEAVGMLRGSVVSGTRMKLEMTSASRKEGEMAPVFNLELRIGAFDPKTGALSLARCELIMMDQTRGRRELFSTATTVYSGEQAVLGVTGAEPLFLVVQVLPVKAK